MYGWMEAGTGAAEITGTGRVTGECLRLVVITHPETGIGIAVVAGIIAGAGGIDNSWKNPGWNDRDFYFLTVMHGIDAHARDFVSRRVLTPSQRHVFLYCS